MTTVDTVKSLRIELTKLQNAFKDSQQQLSRHDKQIFHKLVDSDVMRETIKSYIYEMEGKVWHDQSSYSQEMVK